MREARKGCWLPAPPQSPLDVYRLPSEAPSLRVEEVGGAQGLCTPPGLTAAQAWPL